MLSDFFLVVRKDADLRRVSTLIGIRYTQIFGLFCGDHSEIESEIFLQDSISSTTRIQPPTSNQPLNLLAACSWSVKDVAEENRTHAVCAFDEKKTCESGSKPDDQTSFFGGFLDQRWIRVPKMAEKMWSLKLESQFSPEAFPDVGWRSTCFFGLWKTLWLKNNNEWENSGFTEQFVLCTWWIIMICSERSGSFHLDHMHTGYPCRGLGKIWGWGE